MTPPMTPARTAILHVSYGCRMPSEFSDMLVRCRSSGLWITVLHREAGGWIRSRGKGLESESEEPQVQEHPWLTSDRLVIVSVIHQRMAGMAAWSKSSRYQLNLTWNIRRLGMRDVYDG